jgi:DNA-directed RNA polymerase subunit RPC12/RpoP
MMKSMNVTFACPQCHHPGRLELAVGTNEFACSECGQNFPVSPDMVDEGRLNRCLVCPSTDLFVRKDFPQRLGVGLVVLGLTASCLTWGFHRTNLTFVILFATALIDLILYLVVPNALMCYRCGAQYRGSAGLDFHRPFNLETHERHRQQKARLEQQRRQPTVQR